MDILRAKVFKTLYKHISLASEENIISIFYATELCINMSSIRLEIMLGFNMSKMF